MMTQEISKLCHVAQLLYATTNVYCLVIDIKARSLIEIPQQHLGHCFCQRIAKYVGIDISYNHIYRQCDISTNVNRQIIYKCPFGFANIIVPLFDGKDLIAALQAGPILTQEPEEYLETKILPLWNLRDEDIKALLSDLKYYPSGDINYLVALSETMSALMTSNLSGSGGGGSRPLEASGHHDSPNLVTSIINFVTSNYSENITLSDAAKYAYVNPSHLSRVFNKKMNCSFRSYLNDIRVEKAKELLCYSNLSLSEISNQVGFSDQSYFNKVFKRSEGFTPGQYRLLKQREA